ncbi:hypothetical protein DPSP01_014124 [Paraphaeosphaeria sporulosa]
MLANISGHRQPASIPRPTVQTVQELRDLLDQADLTTFEIYMSEVNTRNRLAEALLANNESARQALQHGVVLSPQGILEEFVEYEFHIIESWNLTRLGYAENFPTTDNEPMQGRYDVFDSDDSFPLRWAAINNDIALPERQWLRFRRNRRLNLPYEHWGILDNFLHGGAVRVDRSIFQERALNLFGIEIVGPQWRSLTQPNLWFHLIDPPGEPVPAAGPSQRAAQSQPQNRPHPLTGAPVQQPAPAQQPAPGPAPPAPQAGLSRPQGSTTRAAQPSASRRQRPAQPTFAAIPPLSNAPNVGHPVQQAPAPATLAVPAAPNPPAVAQTAAQRVQGQHIALFDAPSPNIPLPAAANFTLAEIMTFIPNHMRSVDMIDRVFSNTGRYQQKALANMATSHRHHPVTDNFIWKFIRGEMVKEYPGVTWDRDNKPHTRPANPQYVLGGLSVTGIRTLEQVSTRGNKPSYPSSPVPFSRLARNVKHLPAGNDALDLTRCVDWVLRNPTLGAQYMFPTDYATVLAVVGGANTATNNHLDPAAIARWLGPNANNRAEGNDMQWEQECNWHRNTYWPAQPNAPAAAPNNVLQAAMPAPTNPGGNHGLQAPPPMPPQNPPVAGPSNGGLAPPPGHAGPSMNSGNMLQSAARVPSNSGASNAFSGAAPPPPGYGIGNGMHVPGPGSVPLPSGTGSRKRPHHEHGDDEDSYSDNGDISPRQKRPRMQAPASQPRVLRDYPDLSDPRRNQRVLDRQNVVRSYHTIDPGLEQDGQAVLIQRNPATVQRSNVIEMDPFDGVNQRYGEPRHQSTQQTFTVDRIQRHGLSLESRPVQKRAHPRRNAGVHEGHSGTNTDGLANYRASSRVPRIQKELSAASGPRLGSHQLSVWTEEELPQPRRPSGYFHGYFVGQAHESGRSFASGNGYDGNQQTQPRKEEPQLERHPEYPGYVQAQPYSPSRDRQNGATTNERGGDHSFTKLAEMAQPLPDLPIDPALLASPGPAPVEARKRPRPNEGESSSLDFSNRKRVRRSPIADQEYEDVVEGVGPN